MIHLRADAADGVSLADDISRVIPRQVRFEDAERALRSRIPMSAEEFYDLEAKMRLRGFTVARLTELDAIDRVKRHLQASMSRGESFSQFWTGAGQDRLLQIAGFHESNPWYWETVYRNNVQSAYNTGRALQVERDDEIAYLEFVGLEDARQTQEICKPRSGVVLPKDDPWWGANWPPLHHGCRSTVRAIYPEEVEYDGVESVPPDGGEEEPQGGFGAWPLADESFYRLTPEMRTRAERYGVLGEVGSVARELGVDGFVIPNRSSEAFGQIQDTALRELARRQYADSRKVVREVIDKTHDRVDRYTYTRAIDPADGAPLVSHYNPRLNEIVIQAASGNPHVFLHEYGHFLDFAVAGKPSFMREDFSVAFDKDLGRIMGTTAAARRRQDRLMDRLRDGGEWNDDPNVSDLFSALTDKRIEGRWNHVSGYYGYRNGELVDPEKNRRNRRAEAFANLFEIYSRRTPGLWTEIRRELPELAKLMAAMAK